ncbi:kinase-like domain-containing protein [Obelidium mucronatum]|nr:kinase-like domain-containing protein [Obelidium mucronatum]
MFMVIDLKTGGDLRYALTKGGKLPEESAKFMLAEILLGVIYLHSKKVVHRDLKPENILLDELGHACLTDFNIATYYKETRLMHAIAGSLSYMGVIASFFALPLNPFLSAPEILDKEKKGYNQCIDFWSLGIILFEMLYGKRPFRGKTDDDVEDAIKYKDYTLPSEPKISSHCSDFIKGFLTRPYVRKAGNGVWVLKIDRQKPKSLNVDETIELEELLYSDHQLKAKPRKINKGGETAKSVSIIRKSLRKIESKFKLFDYTKMAAPAGERKRSAEWDKKLSQFKRSASSLNSSVGDDLRETRSQYVIFEADTMTIASRMSSRTDLSSIGGGWRKRGRRGPSTSNHWR